MTTPLIKPSSLLSRLGTSRLLDMLETRDIRQKYDAIMHHYAYRPFTEKEMKKVMWWVLHGANLGQETQYGYPLVARLFGLEWQVLSFHEQGHSKQNTLTYFFDRIDSSNHSELATHLYLALQPTETTIGKTLEERLLNYGATPLPTLFHRWNELDAKVKICENHCKKAKSQKEMGQQKKWNQRRYENQRQLNHTKNMTSSYFSAIKRAGLESQFVEQFSTWNKADQTWLLDRRWLWQSILGQDYADNIEALSEKAVLERVISETEKQPSAFKKRL